MIPISTKMRPQNLDEFMGQQHFLYKGSLLYNSIKNKTFGSAIFHGPSGTGKTTLARLIAAELDSDFHEINASTTGTKELKEILDRARLRFYGLEAKSSYIYIDEFHRWNKLQQDSLLKALEEGVIKFIASTTENPYFAINNAILSRVRNIYEFKRLDKEVIKTLLLRAANDKERGLGNLDVKYDDKAIDVLAELSNGDARVALDTLGFVFENHQDGKTVTAEDISEAMQRKIGFYDRGDDKYDLLSALQKSIRGSDPDAAIYYFARLVDGGADVQMIGRRLLVIASEDIGMAYPSAISITYACVSAALMVGFPEAAINLAEAVIMLASSPKSNRSVIAYYKAMSDIKHKETDMVPDHLRDSHYKGARDKGLGKDYKYPHDFGGYVKQQYLPDNLHSEGVRYYEPSENGSEANFKKFLEELRKKYGDN